MQLICIILYLSKYMLLTRNCFSEDRVLVPFRRQLILIHKGVKQRWGSGRGLFIGNKFSHGRLSC